MTYAYLIGSGFSSQYLNGRSITIQQLMGDAQLDKFAIAARKKKRTGLWREARIFMIVGVRVRQVNLFVMVQ